MSNAKLAAVVLLSGLVVACGGNKKKVEKAEQSKPASSGDGDTAKPTTDTGDKVVKAEGDMRDILLALQRVHFALDTEELTEPSRQALTEAASKLTKHTSVELHVEGHSDERGTSEYNVALAERRARAVTEYLTRLGVEGKRLHPMSYGEEKPIASGGDKKALSMNRRVDFRLMKGDVRFVLEPGKQVADDGSIIE